jgi:hypothetical protein
MPRQLAWRGVAKCGQGVLVPALLGMVAKMCRTSSRAVSVAEISGLDA